MSDLTDADINGFRCGDRQVCEKIALVWQDWFVMEARNAKVPEDQAEDLVQEMWLSARRFAHSFQGCTPYTLRCWLWAILRNLINRYFLEKKRDVNANAQSLHQENNEGGTSAIDPQDHSTSDPADEILRREQYQIVLAALNELSPRERECRIRMYFEGQTVAEIAEDLGVQQGTVRGYLKTGLPKLGEILRRRLSDKPPPLL